MRIVTIPISISFRDWACGLQLDLPKFNIQIPPKDEKDWDIWALNVIRYNNLTKVPIPDKNYFKGEDGWREWAKFFVDILNFN
jgi:hypothetical protein